MEKILLNKKFKIIFGFGPSKLHNSVDLNNFANCFALKDATRIIRNQSKQQLRVHKIVHFLLGFTPSCIQPNCILRSPANLHILLLVEPSR